MEEGDVNVAVGRVDHPPDPLRQRASSGSEFGKTSAEYMLPDCFGFPASLPSILAHCGIKGFSTQKLDLEIGGAVGRPRLDRAHAARHALQRRLWEGPDGAASSRPSTRGSYGSNVREDLSKSPHATAANPTATYNPVGLARAHQAQRRGERTLHRLPLLRHGRHRRRSARDSVKLMRRHRGKARP